MAIPMAVARAGGASSSSRRRGRSSRVRHGREEFARKSARGGRRRAVPAAARQRVPRRAAGRLLARLAQGAAVAVAGLRHLAFVTSIALAADSTSSSPRPLGSRAVFLLALAGCVPAIRRLPVVGIAHYFCLVQAAAAVGLRARTAGAATGAWRRFQRAPVGAA
jgi:hypothetical protein